MIRLTGWLAQIGINVGEGQTGNLGGIEPKIKWATSGVVAGCDVEVSSADHRTDNCPTSYEIKHFMNPHQSLPFLLGLAAIL